MENILRDILKQDPTCSIERAFEIADSEKQYEKLANTEMLFKMSVHTPYSQQEILEFMSLIGLDIDKTQNIINRFFTAGITNLRDVNKLAILGYLKF